MSKAAWIAAFVAMVAVLAVNLPVLGFDWLMFDDDINVLVNPHLGRGAGESIRWAFENVDYMRRYLPFGWLMFGGILAIDGYNPTVFHAANWLLTGLNTLLIFLVFLRLGRAAAADKSGDSDATFTVIFAATCAALFWSLHPLRTENAAWISGLLYVGSTTMVLIAVLLRLRASETNGSGRVLRAAAPLFYLASLLVYAVYLALPAVLVWAAAARANDGFTRAAWRELRSTAGWWAAALFVGGMNAFARATASEAYVTPGSSPALPWPEAIGGVVRTLVHYLARTLWPGEVGVYYGSMEQWLSHWHVILAAGVVGVAAVLLVRRDTRRAALGWAGAAALSLSPFLIQMDRNFHPSDRYAVLWLAVWGAAVAVGLARLGHTRRARMVQFAGFTVLLALSVGYRRALPNWRDTAALQLSIDRLTANHPSVQLGYRRAAIAFWWLGDHAASARKLADGEKLFPARAAMAETRATLAELDGRWRTRVGTKRNVPPLAVLHVDLGRAWQSRGQRTAAAAHFARAAALAPDYQDALQGWLETRTHE